MTKHRLKTWMPYFQEVNSGIKPFEVRRNDRDFKVGDQLELCEYIKGKNEFTGRICVRTITYMLQGGDFGLKEGFAVLGLKE